MKVGKKDVNLKSKAPNIQQYMPAIIKLKGVVKI